MSADPAMESYIPEASSNEGAGERNQNLPGLGGIYNSRNLQTYHYAGNNPLKYTDPSGRDMYDPWMIDPKYDENNPPPPFFDPDATPAEVMAAIGVIVVILGATGIIAGLTAAEIIAIIADVVESSPFLRAAAKKLGMSAIAFAALLYNAMKEGKNIYDYVMGLLADHENNENKKKADAYDRIVQLTSEIDKLKEDIKALEDDIKNAKTSSEENHARSEKAKKEKILADKEAEKENLEKGNNGQTQPVS